MRVRPIKVLCLLAGLAGVITMMYCDGQKSKALLKGALWNFLSAFLYAVYAIGLNVFSTDDLDYGFYLGSLGLINCILMVPTMLALDIWEIDPIVSLSFGELVVEFGYAVLSTLVFEYVWAICCTRLGPITATVGFTTGMLPTCLFLDFVVMAKPGTVLSQRYVGGICLVTAAFLGISLLSDVPSDDEYMLTRHGLKRRGECMVDEDTGKQTYAGDDEHETEVILPVD